VAEATEKAAATPLNFTALAPVKFDGVSAGFSVASATSIQATAPAGVTTGPLSVTTAGGTATSSSSFIAAPTIASFTPTSGGAGTVVTITGTNFSGASAVKFNGVAAAFSVASATSIQTTAPTGVTTGPLSVTTPGGTATSSSSFIGAPTIASFAPASGPAGTVVTITGTNFAGATAVKFNGVSATFSVPSATSIQTTAQTGVTTGPLSVTTPGGTATSSSSFIAAPTITSFSPANGPVGTTVAITGTNFTAGASVWFNGVSATNVTVTSATTIQATVPTAATTGPVSVTAAGGTATSAGSFTVTAVLIVRKTNGLAGMSDGTVTSSPSGISCGSDCSETYNLNTVVTLKVTPNLLSIFNGWTGCDSVSGTDCIVTMNKAKTVVASFLP